MLVPNAFSWHCHRETTKRETEGVAAVGRSSEYETLVPNWYLLNRNLSHKLMHCNPWKKPLVPPLSQRSTQLLGAATSTQKNFWDWTVAMILEDLQQTYQIYTWQMEDEDRNRKTEIVEIAAFSFEYRWLQSTVAEWPISRPLGHRFSTGRRPWGLWSVTGGAVFFHHEITLLVTC